MEPLLLRVLIACALWTLVWSWLVWRRRFRFGVLSLMLLVAGYAIALGVATESLRIEGRPLQFRGLRWYFERNVRLESAIAALQHDSPNATVVFDPERGVLLAVGAGAVSLDTLKALRDADLIRAAIIECSNQRPGVISPALRVPDGWLHLTGGFESVGWYSSGPSDNMRSLRLFRSKSEMPDLWGWIASPAAPIQVLPENP
jgi:hypothetical protein